MDFKPIDYLDQNILYANQPCKNPPETNRL